MKQAKGVSVGVEEVGCKWRSGWRRWRLPLVKLTFVAGLMVFLVQKKIISYEAMQGASQQWPLLLLGFSSLALAMGLGVVRWYWLLQAVGLHLRPWRVFQLTMIGNFFNIAIPGAVSGDFLKGYYILQQAGDALNVSQGRVVMSIIMDRLVGLSALVWLAAASLGLEGQAATTTTLREGIGLMMGLGALGIAAFYGYLLLVSAQRDPLLKGLSRLSKKFQGLKTLQTLYLSLRGYHTHPVALLASLALSLVIHLLTGSSCWLFARALGDQTVSLIQVTSVVPFGLLINAIPLAPAGMGTGNYAFAQLFGWVDSPCGGDVYSLFALSTILLSSVGGVIYLRFSQANPTPAHGGTGSQDRQQR